MFYLYKINKNVFWGNICLLWYKPESQNKAPLMDINRFDFDN